ncbi:type IV secretory system conjugative DNA transfer family protein [Actinomadura decatromicini]|uniref:Type IV secretion system DNA-binding domain-containig protein n=1 Tax=Actinomadura decatromicini TaxID=2604572 RepID=A0A5D3FB26_9ACTN|nr:type IV secretion system DNA-binding domain-containing protein [Actinomadura decatromicini]TYK44575.1 type IV secretion system DNA-binding domain-containig protein [Actinomadura decatromicini]
MTEALFLLASAVVGLASMGGVLLVRARSAARWRRSLVSYRLRFPRGLDPAAVGDFLAGLSGLSARHIVRPFVVRGVVFEVSATRAGITHHLLVPRSATPVVLSALRASLPGVVAAPDEEYQPPRPTRAAELALSHLRRPLVSSKETLSVRILAGLQPLQEGERLYVQWTAAPLGPVSLVPRTATAQLIPGFLAHLWSGFAAHEPDADEIKAARAKFETPVFLAAGRVGVVSGSPVRTSQLMRRMLSLYRSISAPGVHLYRRRLPQGLAVSAMSEHRPPLVGTPCVVNAAELVTLAAIPVGDLALPGLALGGCRQLAPAPDIPAEGRIVARSNFPGSKRPLALGVSDSLRHLHVIGPTGVGKSTLLLGLITQDMAAGRGVVVVDPKGDLVADVLDRVPERRVGDVVVLDPTDEERPVGLNLLAGAYREPELVTSQLVGIFHRLYSSSWGPRTSDIMNASLLTLSTQPGMTLCEVPLLLTNPAFRRRLVARLDDPVALGPFWGWYEGMSDGERAAAIGPVMNKLRAFLLSRRLRNVLGQAQPRLDLGKALASRKILLVPLSKGLLGEEAAALIGSLVVARLWQAVQYRAGLSADRRPVTFAFIDEFQDYLNLPTGVADILAQARGLGLGLTLAHQHLGQLPAAIRDAVLANARSRIMFQLSATDAHALARELAPHLSATDLGGLGPYEVVATLASGARVAPPATGATLPPPPSTDQAEAARSASREHYGIPRDEVEAAIRSRHEGPRPGGAVGRTEGAL